MDDSLPEINLSSNDSINALIGTDVANIVRFFEAIATDDLINNPFEMASSNVASHDLNESGDDVIFVGEERVIINLCSPDGSPRVTSASTRRIPMKDNGRTECPKTEVESAASTVADKVCDRQENVVICAVCMESSVGKSPHSTNCGHIFCSTCIKQSIKINKKCPMCNKPLTVKNIFPVFI